MRRIDQETVQRIIDAADIVEVVSDFVKLRRSGANYKGLCPFHQEALRYLARKYNIEIVEKEQTDEERVLQNRREALFALNEFAIKTFEANLHDTSEGRSIALAYFRRRDMPSTAPEPLLMPQSRQALRWMCLCIPDWPDRATEEGRLRITTATAAV